MTAPEDTSAEPDNVEAAITAFYQAILLRDPDAAGLKMFADMYRDGVPAHQIVAALENSPEGIVKRPPSLPSRFPLDYMPPGEAGRCYQQRVLSGFLDRYCGGDLVLDVGYSGYDNPEKLTSLPNAIGIDLDYPGYDGITLPFADGAVDTVFSSHCLEHIEAEQQAIRDWHRVVKTGGFIVCIVPDQALYERQRSLPSRWNVDHKRMYTPASLLTSFETALELNTYRVRHLRENDRGYDYSVPPEQYPYGAYEIELVIEKIEKPDWDLRDPASSEGNNRPDYWRSLRSWLSR